MMRGLWTAASGMTAQQTNLDIIANNLANVNTAGFKKSRADFQDLVYQTMWAAGSATGDGAKVPTGLQIGLGVRPAAVQKVFTPGSFSRTGNPFDLAIEGDGFFSVTTPDGTLAYTRDGAFKPDDTGRLVNSDGYVLSPEVTIPAGATNITVGPDGTVTVTMPGQTDPVQVTRIQVTRFPNPAGLSSIGHNLYAPSGASGTPMTGDPGTQGLGTIAQNTLEMSNVAVVEEMVNMIVAQRAYETNSKAIQAADDMLQMANQLRR
jgi:flagellar basal-body rod protein FlgG